MAESATINSKPSRISHHQQHHHQQPNTPTSIQTHLHHSQKFKPINTNRKLKIATPSPTPETQTHKLINLQIRDPPVQLMAKEDFRILDPSLVELEPRDLWWWLVVVATGGLWSSSGGSVESQKKLSQNDRWRLYVEEKKKKERKESLRKGEEPLGTLA